MQSGKIIAVWQSIGQYRFLYFIYRNNFIAATTIEER